MGLELTLVWFLLGFALGVPQEAWPLDLYSNTGTLDHVLEPEEGNHVGTLIWFHSYDETADHWVDIMEDIQEEIPGLKIVLPTAAPRRIMSTGEPGVLPLQKHAWFDLIDRFAYRGMPDDRDDSTGIRMTRAWIRNLIRDEISHSKIPSNRIVLGGFDMGGAISIFTGLTFENTLGGVIGVASWIPLQGRIRQERTKENALLPIILLHGKEDIIVPYKHAFIHAVKFLRETNQPHDTQSYENFKHYWIQGMQDDTIKFLKKVLKSKGKEERKKTQEPQKPTHTQSSEEEKDKEKPKETPTVQVTKGQASTGKTDSIQHEDL